MDEPLLYTQAELDRAIAMARQTARNQKCEKTATDKIQTCLQAAESGVKYTTDGVPLEALKLPLLPPKANRPPGKYLSEGAPTNGRVGVSKIVYVRTQG